jgi:soluble lytic murein transglycosylase
MSARPYSSRTSPARRRARAAARARRRRTLTVVTVIVASVLAIGLVWPALQRTFRDITLPLSHADIIRAQAHEKHLDPALIAGVIYAETKFIPRTSPTGALGLMQIEPETAAFLARRSGGTSFTIADLATPQVNIAYGAYFLRMLLNHYDGHELPALAAYNGGEANADRWVAAAAAAGHDLAVADIPFPETRDYVVRVMRAQRAYRAQYGL